MTMIDHHVNTKAKHEGKGEDRMPHERDESPEQDGKPRSIIRQAATDIDSGLVDTDLHNQPGVQQVRTPVPRDAKAQPQPNVKRD